SSRRLTGQSGLRGTSPCGKSTADKRHSCTSSASSCPRTDRCSFVLVVQQHRDRWAARGPLACACLFDLNRGVLNVQLLSEAQVNRSDHLMMPGARGEMRMQGDDRPLTRHRPRVDMVNSDQAGYMTDERCLDLRDLESGWDAFQQNVR